MTSSNKLCIGMIAGAHGVRGLVRLRSFTEAPEAIADYSPITDSRGERVFKIELLHVAKDCYVAQIDGVTTPEQADELRGTKLFVERDALPQLAAREYYEADLQGMTARDADGKTYGKILALHDHGAGAFLEIGTNKKDSFMLPFHDDYVPEIDGARGEVVVVVPEGWLGNEKNPPSSAESDGLSPHPTPLPKGEGMKRRGKKK